MITEDDARQAAGLLWKAWQAAGTLDALPEACRPASRADGYRIQSVLLAESGSRGWGWKIAATSEAGQKHIGVDGPLGSQSPGIVLPGLARHIAERHVDHRNVELVLVFNDPVQRLDSVGDRGNPHPHQIGFRGHSLDSSLRFAARPGHQTGHVGAVSIAVGGLLFAFGKIHPAHDPLFQVGMREDARVDNGYRLPLTGEALLPHLVQSGKPNRCRLRRTCRGAIFGSLLKDEAVIGER